MADQLKALASQGNLRHIICAGHSLGGAVATLCAAWAQARYREAQVMLARYIATDWVSHRSDNGCACQVPRWLTPWQLGCRCI